MKQKYLIDNTFGKLLNPVIISWFRLSGRTNNPNGEAASSLRAEARDPLWFLTRQWQFGEFNAQDAGSPVQAGYSSNSWGISSYQLANDAEKKYNLNDSPLEALVESEDLLHLFPVEERHRQLDLSIQISTQFNRFCTCRKLDLLYKTAYHDNYKLEFNEQQEDYLKKFPNAFQQYLIAKRKLFDGIELLLQIKSGRHKVWLMQNITLPKETKIILLELADQLISWYNSLYFQTENSSTWEHESMQFKAKFSATEKGNLDRKIDFKTTFNKGELDWHSFEQSGLPAGNNLPTPNRWFIPNPIKIKGMASSRYWEIEDSIVNLYKINAETTDLSKLIWGEFSLLFSDDWFVLPYEMNLGEIQLFTENNSFIVQDVFGFSYRLNPIQSGKQNRYDSWQFLNISVEGTNPTTEISNALCLLPTTHKKMEGESIEEINFIRDEMSDLVWAIEKIIPSPLGSGVKSDELTRQTLNTVAEKQQVPNYVLGTQVPQHWIPFIPVGIAGGAGKIKWQRALMPNTKTKDETDIIPYNGVLLRGESPFYIQENQVPREGKIVSRKFQRTRWLNGKTILWVGKSVQIGKGEGSSGLQFDQLK